MASAYRKMAFPAVIYTALALFLVMVSARVVKSTVIDRMNPDTRNTEEATWDAMHYLRRKNRDLAGEFTKESLKPKVRDVDSLMQQLQLVESEEPTEPEPPTEPEGRNLLAWNTYRKEKNSYDYLKKTLTKRRELWKENNETRGEYLFVPLPELPPTATPEEIDKRAAKYLYIPNLHTYRMQARHFIIASWFKQAMELDEWKKQLGWLKKGYQEHKKTVDPPPEGLSKKDRKKWEAKVFRDFLTEVYMGQPLVCPLWMDGSCIKTWDGTTWEDGQDLKKALKEKDEDAIKAIRRRGRDCLLVKRQAEDVTRANQRMFDAGKGEIYPFVCSRNNRHQAVLWVVAGNGDSLKRVVKVAVQLPGMSNHDGHAMDVTNWKQAQPYLAAEAGMMCNFVDNDKGHCSIGEVELSKYHIKRKSILDLIAAGEDIRQLAKEHGVDFVKGLLGR